jgi:uncharacterized protein YdhG (YjbR/CyaY superfamily)
MASTKTAATREDTSATSFTDAEKSAMRERAKELKSDADGEALLLAKIAEMTGDDRSMAERIHAVITASAPALSPTTWYGMPAWARDGKIIAFFQPAAKFKARYSTIGFNDGAHLDDGAMWPTSYALTKLSAADEARIAELIKKAAG